MKKSISAIILFFVGFQIQSQEVIVANFEDGATYKYEIISDKAEDCRKLTVTLNPTHRGFAFDFLEVEYFKPKKYLLHANVGLNTYGVSGIYFLTEKRKAREQNVILDKKEYSNKIKRYPTKVNLTAKRNIGIHGGYEYVSYFFGRVTAHALTVGLGMYTVRYLDLAVKSPRFKKMVFQVSNAIYLDAVYFPVVSVHDKGSGNTDVETTNFGTQLYMQTKFGKGRNSLFGYAITLGIMSTPYRLPGIMAGFGVFMGFDK